MKTHLKHEPILYVQQHLLRFTVIANENMQGVTVFHPTQKPGIRGQGNNREGLYVQSALEAISVYRQKRVDKTEELHDSFVLTEVLMTFVTTSSLLLV
jgi:hypothetical protein